MTIKCSNRAFDNASTLNEISRSMTHLSINPDALHFVHEMMYLSELLSRTEENQDSASQAIEANVRDPSYYIAAYFDTRSLDAALRIYKVIRALTKHILFYDRFCETGDNEYASLAKQALASAAELGRSESGSGTLALSVEYGLRQFSEYWHFEQATRRRMLQCHYFSYPEIRNFLLSKSSDAPLVYAKVLESRLPTFNGNVSMVLHYNQALLDIFDDWDDIEEDLNEDMPNIFVMAALAYLPYGELKKFGQHVVRQIVLNEFSISRCNISKLVSELHASIKDIALPENFVFLKVLSDLYVNTLRKQMALTSA